VEEHGPI